MSPVRINYWAEGPTDRAAARKLIRAVGAEPGDDYSVRRTASSGKDYPDARLRAFNAAAHWQPWLVLRDSDRDCAAELATRLLHAPAPHMRFRLVVPSIEAWLLADREQFARYIGVTIDAVPDTPEQQLDAKATVLELARRSTKRTVREAMLPNCRSGRREGRDYAASMIEFINSIWTPTRAAANSPSLSTAIERLRSLVPA